MLSELSWKILSPAKKSWFCEYYNMIVASAQSQHLCVFQSRNGFRKTCFWVTPLKNSHHYLLPETEFPLINFIAAFWKSSIGCWCDLRIVRSRNFSFLIPYLRSFDIISCKFANGNLLNELFPWIKSFFHQEISGPSDGDLQISTNALN